MDISFVLRKFRKSISGFTILALLTTFVSFVGVAQASSFPDAEGHWGEAYIEALYDAGVVSGNDDGTFGPDDTLDRAALSKMLVLAYTDGVDEDATNPYADVSEDDWYHDYAASAYSYGIMTGEGDGSFNGAGEVNRATLMQAVYNAAGLSATGSGTPFNDVMESDWFYDAVDAGYNWSIIDGEDEYTFNPAGLASRAAAAKVVYNGWYPVERGDEEPDTEPEPEPEPSSDGTLLMSVASDNPSGATLPSGATSVELFALDLTADNDDVVLDGITVNHYGVSSLPTAHSVYAYATVDGEETRLTSGQSINSSTHDVTFSNLDLEVEEGDDVRLAFRLDVGTVSATGEVALQVESADMVDANGDVDGDFALQGESFDLSTTAAGTITIEKNGSVDNAQIGEDGAEIAKFKMTAATESANLEELGLYISGSIDTDDIANFQLWVSGEDEAVASVDAVDSLDVARFMLDNYAIEKGSTKSFTVTADFNTGRTTDNIKAYIDEDTDVLATGDLYGYGMAVTRASYDGNDDACASASSVDCSYLTLEGGDVTVTSGGPSASDIAINADNVTIMEFDVAAVTDVTFKNFPISLTATETSGGANSGLLNTTAANITDIKIVNTATGESVFSSVDVDVFVDSVGGTDTIADADDTTIHYHLYTDDLEMSAGEELSLALMVDVENNSALAGDTLVAGVALGETYPELRDSNNKTLTNSSVLVPASPLTSKTHTFASPSLTLSLASTPVAGSTTEVKGSQDVDFAGFVFACGDASACRITDMTVQGYLDDNGSADNWAIDATSDHSTSLNEYVGSIWLEDADGNVIDGPESVNGTNFTSTFSNIDWTVDAGETEILYVMGDINSDAYKNSNGENIAFGISSTANVTVEDADGSTFTPSGTVNATGLDTTDPTTFVTVSDGGSLTISVDASSPKEDILVAGSSDQEVSVYNFESTDEAFVVTDLALNALQSAVTAASLGDYDNNLVEVSVSYENSEGSTETSTGYVVEGTATFSGLDMYVPADDDAELTVYATSNTISGGATAAEFVELNLSLNDFEAIAQGSGETYTGSKLDRDTDASSDLDIGTISFTDPDDFVLAAAITTTAGSSVTFTMDDGNGASTASPLMPVGTIVCFDISVTENSDDDGGNAASCDQSTDTTGDTMVVITAVTNGDTTDSYTGYVLATEDADDTDVAIADDTVASYALPGAGYMTETNSFHVYETKPTLALSSSSPSGDRTVSSSDDAFVFTISADAEESVKIRAAVEAGDTIADGAGTPCNIAASSGTAAGDHIDGASALCTVDSAGAGDTFSWDVTGTDLSAYTRVNFWIQWDEVAAGADAQFADLKIGTATAVDGNDQQTALDQTSCGADQSTMVDTEWYNCDLAMPVGTADSDTFFLIELDEVSEISNSDLIYIDEVKFYNEKLTVDLSTDTDLDTYLLNTSNAGSPVEAYLTDGSSVVATAYVGTLTNGASATSTGSVTFLPTTEIEIDDGDTETFTLRLDTSDLLNEDDGSDDPLTFSIDLGSSTARTVTAGDFWWYDTNATVKWVGHVSSSTLTSNTVNY